MTRYVALLRGINVGGRNVIKMKDLAACFEDHGFGSVSTYIQSGNVVFEARQATAQKLVKKLETMLSQAFDYSACVVVRSLGELRATVERAPRGFGSQPARYRYDVLYLMPSLTAKAALEVVPTRPGVDQVSAGPGALYFSRLIAKASQSRLSRITGMPVYQSLTIRNWNTTRELLRLLDDA
jgi:uncharacterized protein (DUF1697 family)